VRLTVAVKSRLIETITGTRRPAVLVVGDDCVIGANAVVHTSVPAGHVAVGVPAISKIRETTEWPDADE
jgi:tetrahydrodipicolinate N-succinyltransferase